MSEVFREVDEMMRQERLEKFWAENKNYIIGFIVGTILLTGIISGYRSWDNGVKEKQTATLITMQEAANYPDNLIEMEKLDLRGGLRGIAYLQGAAAALDKDNTEGALTLYSRASKDNGIPNDLQELATLMAVRLDAASLENAENQQEKAKALIEQLQPVINSGKNWSAQAKLEAAAIHANILSDTYSALELIKSVSVTEGLPETLYARANALEQLYQNKNAEPES